MSSARIFVPYADGRISAAVTLPDGDVRGAVLLLLHAAAPDIVGGSLWGWAAPRLAADGLASIRLDYAAFGDSSGEREFASLDDAPEHAAQARAVLAALTEGRPLPFAAVGACHDGRVALELAADPDCVCAICIDMPFTRRAGQSSRLMQSWAAHIARHSRSNAAVRAIAGPALRARQAEPRVRAALKRSRGKTRVIFVGDGTHTALKGFGPEIPRAQTSALATPPEIQPERLVLTPDDEQLLALVVNSVRESIAAREAATQDAGVPAAAAALTQ